MFAIKTTKKGKINRLALVLCFGIFVLIAIFLSLNANGYSGGNGAGDDNREYNCGGSCHTNKNIGGIVMETTKTNPSPNEEITLTVKVKEMDSTNEIGVFLIKELAPSNSQPSVDGWEIINDANGNANNYVEKPKGDEVVFNWTLKAPSKDGTYKLFARVHHSSYGTDNDTGLTFNVGGDAQQKFTGKVLYSNSAFAGNSIPIEVEIANMEEVELNYKPIGKENYEKILLSKDGNWKGKIPSQNFSGNVKFYISAKNSTAELKSEEYKIKISYDLIPLSISFSESEVQIRKEIKIAVKIKNNGSVDAENIRVGFFDDFYNTTNIKYIGFVSNLTISKNSEIEVKAWWMPVALGEHKIRVVVDIEGIATEGEQSKTIQKNVSVIAQRVEQNLPIDMPQPLKDALKYFGIPIPTAQELIDIWVVFFAILIALIVVLFVAKKLKRKGKT